MAVSSHFPTLGTGGERGRGGGGLCVNKPIIYIYIYIYIYICICKTQQPISNHNKITHTHTKVFPNTHTNTYFLNECGRQRKKQKQNPSNEIRCVCVWMGFWNITHKNNLLFVGESRNTSPNIYTYICKSQPKWKHLFLYFIFTCCVWLVWLCLPFFFFL